MSFSADTDVLRQVAGEMEQLGVHSTRYRNYSDSYVALGWREVGSIYGAFWETAGDVNEGLADHAHDFASVQSGSKADDELREALGVLRDSAPDEKLAHAAGEILEGRAQITDLLNHSSFDDLAAKGQRLYEQTLASLSDADRRDLERTAQEQVDGYDTADE